MRKCHPKFSPFTIIINQRSFSSNKKRDVVVIGGGHNGLIAGNYLARKGLQVTIVERRKIIGGAAVTEEITKGFKCSRASYLAGLLRPQIIKDLELEKYGFKYLPRDPSSFTPTMTEGKYLMLGVNEELNSKSIGQFSGKDARKFAEYEEFLGTIREIVEPLLDGPPPDLTKGSFGSKLDSLKMIMELLKKLAKNFDCLVPLYELLTAPASHILNRYFESEILKSTLATDSVIGAMLSPSTPGSAYVLLHHVMGEAAGKKGVWAYVEGGMGTITQAIAKSGIDKGMEIISEAPVSRILVGNGKAIGVQLENGEKIFADYVLSNATPHHTFTELLSLSDKNAEAISPFIHHIKHVDYSSAVMKVNVALDKLPNFICYPTEIDPITKKEIAGPQHRGTIHFETTMKEIEDAFQEAYIHGRPSSRPVIEMTIPTSLDKTLAPVDKHVCTLFIQYVPYELSPTLGSSWEDPQFKKDYVENIIFKIIDEKAPGFSESVIAYDALSPLDLERVFGLHKGNIFHGALALHQLAYARPAPFYSSHRTPIPNLYLCGAGCHPGGGVMGSPGRNCACILLRDLDR